MDITYRSLNKELGIGLPVVEIIVDVFEVKDIVTPTDRPCYVQLPALILQTRDGQHRFVNCFLYARSIKELLDCAGKKARAGMVAREKVFSGKGGKVHLQTFLDLTLTDDSVTHSFRISSKIEKEMSWTQGRPKIRVAHAKGYGIVLSPIEKKGKRPILPIHEEVRGEDLPVLADNVLRLPVCNRRGKDRDYQWIRGMRVPIARS